MMMMMMMMMMMLSALMLRFCPYWHQLELRVCDVYNRMLEKTIGIKSTIFWNVTPCNPV
jgi:hypothetical protein